MKRFAALALFALPVLACLIFLAAHALVRARGSDGPPWVAQKFSDPKDAFDFTLTDQDGKPFRLDQLRGKLVLMTFGFTHCPNVCPTTLAALAAVNRALSPAEREQLRVVFISVDPDRDTPKIMKDYVPFYDPEFIGLTGASDAIEKTAKAYGVYFERKFQTSAIAADYYTIDHSTYVYVIGRDGRWIGLYDNDRLGNTDRMVEDVRRFLAPGNG